MPNVRIADLPIAPAQAVLLEKREGCFFCPVEPQPATGTSGSGLPMVTLRLSGGAHALPESFVLAFPEAVAAPCKAGALVEVRVRSPRLPRWVDRLRARLFHRHRPWRVVQVTRLSVERHEGRWCWRVEWRYPDASTLFPAARESGNPVGALLRRVEALAALEEGWYEGCGKALPYCGARWAGFFFACFVSTGCIPPPLLLPTPEGGLALEWTWGLWEVGAEVDLRTRRAELHAANVLTAKSARRTVHLGTAWGCFALLHFLLRYRTLGEVMQGRSSSSRDG